METSRAQSKSTDLKIEELKSKYLNSTKENPNQGFKKLIFEAAIEKDAQRRVELSHQLSEVLIEPDGIVNLFLDLLDFDTSSQKNTTHNQRFIAVANIITRLPKLCVSYERYCDNLIDQLRPMLVSDDTRYSSLACIIIKSMIDSPHAKSIDIYDSIFKPIVAGLHNVGSRMRAPESIIAIHNLIQNRTPAKNFTSEFPNLLASYLTLEKTPSSLKNPIKTILIQILNNLKPGAACCLIEETLFHSLRTAINLYSTEFSASGIKLRIADNNDDTKEKINDGKIVETILMLLEKCDNDLLVLEFFFHFSEQIWITTEPKQRDLSVLLVEPLLEQTIQENASKFDLIGIVGNNVSRSLELIFRTLMNQVASMRQTDNSIETCNQFMDKSLLSCVNILQVLSLVSLDCNNIEFFTKKCLPLLKEIQELMQKSVRTDRKSGRIDETIDHLTVLIQRLEQLDNSRANSNMKTNTKSEVEFDGVMRDLNDKLVPVRVHALVRLKQMIMAKDQYVLDQIPRLYDLVESTLSDNEPYVFLASINTISEMALHRTREILPKLIELYSANNLNINQRISVGEVLIQLTKKMNETAPFYAQQVMSILLNGCQDDEELIKMSSLTNIGELSRNLSDSLGKYIVDILACIQRVLSDDSIQVRCAAIDLLRTMLMGLDSVKVESIQRNLGEIYRLLKDLRRRTIDDTFCLQADLALDEIDRLARGLLIGQANSRGLVKNIELLSVLGNK